MSTKPEESREAERLALEFVERGIARLNGSPQSYPADDKRCLMALKAMLAQPRLPKAFDEGAREAFRRGYNAWAQTEDERWDAGMAALHAHLTAKPKPTWTVTWHSKDRRITGSPHGTENIDLALAAARKIAEQGHVVTIRCDAP